MNIIWLESSCRWGPQRSRYRRQSGTSLEWWWRSAWQSTNSTWPRCFTSATVSRGKNGGGCWGVVWCIWFLYGCFYADIQSFILSFDVFRGEPHRTATEKQQKRLEHVQQTTTATSSVATIVKLAVGTWYRPKYYTYIYIYTQNHWPPADGTWPAWQVQTNIFFEDFEPNQSTNRPAAQRIVSAARWRCIHWVWKHTCSPSWIDTHP